MTGDKVGASVGKGCEVLVAGGGWVGIGGSVRSGVEVCSRIGCFLEGLVGGGSVGGSADSLGNRVGLLVSSIGTKSCWPAVIWSAASKQLTCSSTLMFTP